MGYVLFLALAMSLFLPSMGTLTAGSNTGTKPKFTVFSMNDPTGIDYQDYSIYAEPSIASNPKISPTSGVIVSDSTGIVRLLEYTPGSSSVIPPGRVVHNSTTRKFVPAAICDNLIAVADSNLFFYKVVGPNINLVQTLNGSPQPYFDKNRKFRDIEFHCSGEDSFIAATTGSVYDPPENEVDPTFIPKIHIFSPDIPSAHTGDYGFVQTFDLSTWVHPDEGTATAFFQSGSYYVRSAYEKVSTHNNRVASIVGGANPWWGTPIVAHEIGTGDLWFTRGTHACQSDSSVGFNHVLEISAIDAEYISNPGPGQFIVRDQLIMVACPATNGNSPRIQGFKYSTSFVCGTTENTLSEVTTLFAATSGVPSFDLINSLNPIDFSAVVPSVAWIRGARGTSSPLAKIVVGNPGKDSLLGDRDVGEVWTISLTSNGAGTWAMSLESTYAPPLGTASGFFGAQGSDGFSSGLFDYFVVSEPGVSRPQVTFGAGPVSSLMLTKSTTPFPSFVYDTSFGIGASMDATDQWLAATRTDTVLMYSNADGVEGFGPTPKAATGEQPSLHSTVYSGPHPFVLGSYRSGSTQSNDFRGFPIVKFIPGTSFYDAAPRLLVLAPLTSPSATPGQANAAWRLRMYAPTLNATATLGVPGAPQNPSAFVYAQADPSWIQWDQVATLAMPSGYSPCSTLYDLCLGDTISCFAPVEDACASTIEIVDRQAEITGETLADRSQTRQRTSGLSPEQTIPLGHNAGPRDRQGLGAPFPGCSDGVVLALPDAAGTPSIVLVCVHGVRSQSALAPSAIIEPMQSLTPGNRADGRIVLGQSCTPYGVMCVNSTARTTLSKRPELTAGTKIVAGIMSGHPIIGANNDVGRMEFFRFSEATSRFESFIRPQWVTTGPFNTPQSIHPVAFEYGKDVALVSDLGVVMSASNGWVNLHYMGYMASSLQFYISEPQNDWKLDAPGSIKSISTCANLRFGTRIMADSSLIRNEGIVVVLSQGIPLAGPCNNPSNIADVSTDASVVATVFTVTPHPYQQLAVQDSSFDSVPSSPNSRLARSKTLITENSLNVTELPSTMDPMTLLYLDGDLASEPRASFKFLTTATYTGIDKASLQTFGFGSSSEMLMTFRTWTATMTRTGRSRTPWRYAQQAISGADMTRKRLFEIGATNSFYDIESVLRAGSGFLRFFVQTGTGILQIEQRPVAVNYRGNDQNTGSLLSPLESLKTGVDAACADYPAMCIPVAVVGDAGGGSPIYSGTDLQSSDLPSKDAAESTAIYTGSVSYEVKRGTSWQNFNVTIKGAGVDRTRLVLELPPTGMNPTDTALTVGSISLQDLTIEGGSSAYSNGFGGLRGAGVLTVSGTTAARARVALQRVRVRRGKAQQSGGLISLSNADLNAVECMFSEGVATQRGGALATEGSNVAVSRSVFYSNNANTQSGGGLYASSSSFLAFDQTHFESNTAGNAGGAIALTSSDALLLRCELHRNSAFSAAGAIDSTFGKLLAVMSTFVQNTANGADGGAVSISQSSGTPLYSVFLSCSFLANSAAGSGGAVRVQNAGRLKTRRSLFAYNSANSQGGAVSVQSQNAAWVDGGSVVYANAAIAGGGGASVSASATTGFAGTLISTNAASSGGGGMECLTNGQVISSMAYSPAVTEVGHYETAAELAERGVTQAQDAVSVTIESNDAPSGAGMLASSCRGSMSRPLFQLNAVGFSEKRMRSIVFYATAALAGLTRPQRIPPKVDPYRRHVDPTTITTDATSTALGGNFGTMWHAPNTPLTTAIASSVSRLTSIPPSVIEDKIPAIGADVSSLASGVSSYLSNLGGDSIENGGGGLWIGLLSSYQGPNYVLQMSDARFKNNTAQFASGGGIFAAGISDSKQCTNQPAQCYRNGVGPALNYLKLIGSLTFDSNSASRGAAVFWTQGPFAGAHDIATANGRTAIPGPAGLSTATSASPVTLTGNSLDTSSTSTVVIESMPYRLQFQSGYGVATNVAPSGMLASNPSGEVQVARVDAYSTISQDSYTLTASLQNGGPVGSLDGVTSTQSDIDTRVGRFLGLTVTAAAGTNPTYRFALSTAAGVQDLTGSILMKTTCDGRQELTFQNSRCVQCAISRVSDGTACLLCPIGQVVDQASIDPRGQCVNCSAGEYAENGVCTKCNPGGITALPGLGSCQACPLGKVARTFGLSTCESCPAGFTSDGTRTSCISCGANQVSQEGAISGCVTCAQGHQPNTAKSQCIPCSAGTFGQSGATCEPCAIGTNQTATGASNCLPCELGSIAADTGRSSCTACPAGSTSNGARDACITCGPLQFSQGGLCLNCAPGWVPTTAKSSCVACDAGTYASNTEGKCITCATGQVAPPGSSSCAVCPPGHKTSANRTTCEICPPGTYASNGECLTCAVGQVSLAGASVCTQCNPGHAPNVARTECVACQAGFSSLSGVSCERCGDNLVSDAGAVVCQRCGPGTQAGPSQAKCVGCPPGSESPNGVCTQCSSGRFNPVSNATSCSQCNPGTFAFGSGSVLCETCAGNKVVGSFGATACSDCPAGSIALDGKTRCGDCPPGSQAVTGVSGDPICQTCSAGHVSASGSACSLCPSGTIANLNRTACLPCPAVGVSCSANLLSINPGYWWSDGAIQVGIDVENEPWVYLPQTTVMHACPSVKSCNVSLNAVLAEARTTNSLLAATNTSLARRIQLIQNFLISKLVLNNDGVSCSNGFEGPRCALCSKGFARVTGVGDCTPCLDEGLNWLIVLAGLIVIVGAASFLVWNTYRANTKGKAGSNVGPALIRIVANYLKIQSTLGDFKARAPEVIMAIRNGASTVSSGIPVDVGPVSCAFSLNFERQLLATLMLPAVIIVAVSFVCFFMYLRATYCPACPRCCCCRRRNRKIVQSGSGAAPTEVDELGGHVRKPSEGSSLKTHAGTVSDIIQQAADEGRSVHPEDRPIVKEQYTQFAMSAMTILLFLIYSMLVKQVFTAWRLYSIPIKGRYFLAADFSVHTTSPAYSRISIMAFVGVFLWVLGIPAAAIVVLYRNRKRLLDEGFLASFGFLYAGYNVGTAYQLSVRNVAQAKQVLTALKVIASQDAKIMREESEESRRWMETRVEEVDESGAATANNSTPRSVSRVSAVDPRIDESKPTPPPEEASGKDEEGELEVTTLEDVPPVDSARGSSASGIDKGVVTPTSAAVSTKPRRRTRRARRASQEMQHTNFGFLTNIIGQFEQNAEIDNQSWWFWEVVVLARLVLITMIAVFVEDTFLQSYLALAVVIAALIAHLAAHPYSDSVLDMAEALGLVTVMVTQLGSLLWYLNDSKLAQIDDTAVTIILIIVNVLVLVIFALMFVLASLGAHRIVKVPYCGSCLMNAFFRERDLRRQLGEVRERDAELEMTKRTLEDLRHGRIDSKRAMVQLGTLGGVAVAAGVGAGLAAADAAGAEVNPSACCGCLGDQ
jgi:hypothetical protein